MYRNQDETKTLDRLTKAMERQHPVTLSYVRADSERVLRTIEIYEVPEGLTKGGNRIIRALDRETGLTRSWRVDRIVSYTIHRSRFLIERCPEHHHGIERCADMHAELCEEHETDMTACKDWTHNRRILAMLGA